MIVVSDTSPLSALISIGRPDLLPALFGEVMIPPAVHDELCRFHSALPAFLRVREIANGGEVAPLLDQLDRGEAEAIVLARETGADYLLMDEMAGRKRARQLGLRVIGVMGVLVAAKQRGLIGSLRDTLDQLEAESTFFASADLKQWALTEAGET